MYTRKKSPPGGRPSREKVYDRKFKTFVMHKEVFAFAAARLVRQFKGVPYQELVGLVQRNDRERDTARLDTLAGFSTDGRLRAQMNIEGQNLSSSYRKIRTRMLRYPCRLVADQKERQVPTVSLRTYHWGWGWEDSSPCCSPASWRRGRRWRCCGHGGSP